ncbi:CDP-diacylglycerol--glycerol-3-phosphate 3-phosphatidyltransferase, mitochondrial-like isoform X1 [Haliotis rufescens]|uniref:CDP-diacylglycerol--glycerol-3-phosphate 3-phosphatidyltransferase, mitochondrial-like isoform X1 n=1 Tax=Haliotis rufescens TaxID=6454 RepID=UPI00201F61ED|nr:CDP-diacylglycerol--glycerol-3-phosphate 3-phosphatidyltransferase, mitochondrial-like isoform X1 [Haliotis rufescens]
MAEKHAFRLLLTWKNRHYNAVSRFATTYQCNNSHTGVSDPLQHTARATHRQCSTRPHVFDYFGWMGKFTPCYRVKGDQVLVITEPTQFYEVLKIKARKARKRITIASLYLGTGQLEHDLVGCVREACENARKDGNCDMKVNILLDYTRGSRGKTASSRTMLQSLLKDFPSCMDVSLYHTPDLRGLLKRVVPERFNETIGLTHLKVYLFDDSVIISGANLSDNYFTNRQDRYVLFNDSKSLADFFDNLVKTVGNFSFKMNHDNTLTLPDDESVHPFTDKDDGCRFKRRARKHIQNLLTSAMEETWNMEDESRSSDRTHSEDDEDSSSGYDTLVYPLIQMGPFGITHDENITLKLFRSASQGDEILLASGYFNLTDHYMNVILQESYAKYGILMASPEVNGFFGAKGIAGSIPTAYVHIANQFFKSLVWYGQTRRIQMFEYFRDKWTFHVKGLWYYLPGESLPSLTFIGSPNFGYRSVYRDLECQLAVVTENKHLREQLREEHVRLYQSSNLVTSDLFKRKDRHVPMWAKAVTTIIKNFF